MEEDYEEEDYEDENEEESEGIVLSFEGGKASLHKQSDYVQMNCLSIDLRK